MNLKTSKEQESSGALKRKAVGLFFLGLFLMVVVEVGIDGLLGDWGRLHSGWVTQVLGPLITSAGIALIIWSVISQYTIGNGSPVPKVATQKLVTQGPYFYTRNPMTLGAWLFYIGIGVWMRSGLLIILIVFIFSALLVFIYKHETHELADRFGKEYLDYQRKTPFLFPNFRRVAK